MVKKRIKRPKDPAALAHLIMGIATGNVKDEVEDGKNPIAAVDRFKSSEIKGSRFFALRKGAIPSIAAPVPPEAKGCRPIALRKPFCVNILVLLASLHPADKCLLEKDRKSRLCLRPECHVL